MLWQTTSRIVGFLIELLTSCEDGCNLRMVDNGRITSISIIPMCSFAVAIAMMISRLEFWSRILVREEQLLVDRIPYFEREGEERSGSLDTHHGCLIMSVIVSSKPWLSVFGSVS